MKNIIDNTITLIGAIIGIIGGSMWAYKTSFDYEPVILVSLSVLTLLGYIILKMVNSSSQSNFIPKDKETSFKQKVEVNVNVDNTKKNDNQEVLTSKTNKIIDNNSTKRNAIIESRKPLINILFIDDDTKFKTVKIFKDSGWKNTKTVVDIKSIDLPIVQNSHIIFVDINGVGKLLGLEYEGLDLALMLKQKYPQKKIVIYSANKNANSFHKAWDIIDARIEKNALPIQFQNVAENYCLSNN